jgi:hypothetical protein
LGGGGRWKRRGEWGCPEWIRRVGKKREGKRERRKNNKGKERGEERKEREKKGVMDIS